MKKNFVRIHNQFMYIYSNIYAPAPSAVVSMEKATVEPSILWNGVMHRINDDTNRRTGYYGFRMQFPATYNREFFTTSEQECKEWIDIIRDMTEVRKIEDYYNIREKNGEGRFAEVYRVGTV